MKKFSEWVKTTEGTLPKSDRVNTAIDNTLSGLDAQIKALYDKKSRISKGMGVGQYAPVDHSAEDLDRRSRRLSAAQNNTWGVAPEMHNLFQVLLRDDDMKHPLPASITPQQGEELANALNGTNPDYEDFQIYRYDPKSHHMIVGDKMGI